MDTNMRTRVSRRLLGLITTALVTTAVVWASTEQRQSSFGIETLRAEVRRADLRGDWAALATAREHLRRHAAETGDAVAHYQHGYASWRMASLAFLAGGPAVTKEPLEQALKALDRAATASPALADAHALVPLVAGALIAADPARGPVLGPRIGQAVNLSMTHGADKPSVQLALAMFTASAPASVGGDRRRGVADWRKALASFERETADQAPATPGWQPAEAWGWLGGVHLVAGEHDDARAAFTRALQLEPDFWWVRRIARPLLDPPRR